MKTELRISIYALFLKLYFLHYVSVETLAHVTAQEMSSDQTTYFDGSTLNSSKY